MITVLLLESIPTVVWTPPSNHKYFKFSRGPLAELKITACHLSFSNPKATMTDQIKNGLTLDEIST